MESILAGFVLPMLLLTGIGIGFLLQFIFAAVFMEKKHVESLFE